MATLQEKYAKRISLAEKYYAKHNAGATLDGDRKMVLAQVLSNTSKFLTEAFENSVSTQRSDMGLFKRFALDITTLTLPNLIAPELVLVQPLTAMHGYITYFEYVKGSNKGESAVGDLIVNPFKNGKVDLNYTSSTVVENAVIAEVDSKSTIVLKWGPVVPGSIAFTIGNDKFFDGGDGFLYQGKFASKRFTAEQVGDDERLEGQAGRFIVDAGTATKVGTVKYGFANSKSTNKTTNGHYVYDDGQPTITFDNEITGTDPVEVNYIYNNVAIMQNDLPYITVRTKGIYLMAKARRVAINYSQIAAFQAKQEYGQDLGKRLEQVAIGTLKYEIDTEITNLLVENSTYSEDLEFNATVPTGISLAQHYEGFARIIEIGKQKVYAATQKFFPNYMLAGSGLMTILPLTSGFKAANTSNVNGPFFYGTYNGMKVFITPNMDTYSFVLGVNGDDYGTSAAVYAPYMAVVPTSLLQTPDGATTQGWSTLYALEILNKDLLVAGAITFKPQVINISAQE